jgi:hypothetical protein
VIARKLADGNDFVIAVRGRAPELGQHDWESPEYGTIAPESLSGAANRSRVVERSTT